MSMRQTRARNIRIRITDPLLTHLEKYCKLSGMDMEDYLVGCGTEYPQLIAQLETIKQERDQLKGTPNEPNGTVQSGAEETTGEASV